MNIEFYSSTLSDSILASVLLGLFLYASRISHERWGIKAWGWGHLAYTVGAAMLDAAANRWSEGTRDDYLVATAGAGCLLSCVGLAGLAWSGILFAHQRALTGREILLMPLAIAAALIAWLSTAGKAGADNFGAPGLAMTVFELVALATIVWNFRALKLVPYRLPARLMQAGCILLLGLYAVDLLRIVARDAMALYAPPTAWVKADLSLWFLLNFCMLMLVSFRAVESHRRKAHVDPLTDVLNRRGLQAGLRPHLNAQAVGARMGVLMLDLDFFKSINDRFGHDGGDFVLQQLALTLEQCVRSSDLVARLGGEEFIVVLPGSSLEASAAQAERIRLRIADMSLDQLLPGLRITASIGVSCASLDDMPIAELIHVADLALYDAKHQGRNRVCCRSRGA